MTTVQAAVGPQLTKALRAQVTELERDLLARARDVPEFADRLTAEYDAARAAWRTGVGFTEWREGRVTQAAAAWVLATVFVRYCEDNGLIGPAFLAGPAERLLEAEERHEQFFRVHPNRNDRDWLLAAIEHIADAHPTAAGLFDRRHNPLWELTPSYEAATALIGFWRRRGGSAGSHHTFDGWDTRFLGDLYQDLSESARKTYALLQTPEFVEEFILDLTLDPAIEEFGLSGLRTIDPACGSGHFLLGLFRRILAEWRRREPNTDDWELITRALRSVHGCDKNPFATSIARFRLLVAALREGGTLRLDRAREFPINVAVGDSLLHGRGVVGKQGELFETSMSHTYSTEDVNEFVRSCDLLRRGSYHVVVGNPPYVEVKERQEKKNYKARYKSCSGLWVLSVPFAERLFQLAVWTNGEDRQAGYVGQITANSFMKREFGKKLIEGFFPTVHLTHVIDTSGVYVPGHGTPTVILLGRNHLGRPNVPIRAVLGLRGEPSQPTDPARGLVWTAIVEQIKKPGSASEWVALEDVDRTTYARYPWSQAAGAASDLFVSIGQPPTKLGTRCDSIGYTGQTNADDVFLASGTVLRRRLVSDELHRPFVTGDDVRDYAVSSAAEAIFPYSTDGSVLVDPASSRALMAWVWPYRGNLGARATFNQKTYREEGRPWWSWHQVAKSRLNVAVSTGGSN